MVFHCSAVRRSFEVLDNPWVSKEMKAEAEEEEKELENGATLPPTPWVGWIVEMWVCCIGLISV